MEEEKNAAERCYEIIAEGTPLPSSGNHNYITSLCFLWRRWL